MINDNKNKSIDKIDKDSYSVSTSKDSTNLNEWIEKDAPSSPTIKPWFKKKSSIIAMSSTLGAAILTTAIAVPLSLTSTNSKITGELTKVVTVYDLAKKTARLNVEGKDLPSDKSLYSVYKETAARALTLIPSSDITLLPISATEINLDFKDPTITNTTIYQVKLNNGTNVGNEVISKPNQSVPLPVISINVQPIDQSISSSTTTLVARLSVTLNTIVNPISGQTPLYQWKSSDANSNDEKNWTPVANATKSVYEYPIKDISLNVKKYFKCVISYKYASILTTNIVFVEKVNIPTIAIDTVPTNVDLSYIATSSPLSVVASVVNGNPGQVLAYQWKSCDTETGTYVDIVGATTATYNYDQVSTITPGAKRYFKCIVSYPNVLPIETTPVFISRALKPIITFDRQIGNVRIYGSETSTQLSVSMLAENVIDFTTPLTYKWFLLTSETDANGTILTGKTSAVITYDATGMTVGQKRYFKCEVTYPGADKAISDVGSLEKLQNKPTISISSEASPVTLTSTSTNFSLTIAAAVANKITGINDPTYQWQVADTQTGRYKPAYGTGMNTKSFSKTLDANKNALKDGWYKCIVRYPDATAVESNPVLVKMTLTTVEAKAELTKWLGGVANYRGLLQKFFNGATTDKHSFYSSLHENEFVNLPTTVGSTFPNIVAEDFQVASIGAPSIKSYKIKLTTKSASSFKVKGSNTTTDIPIGSIIEFNTLFSFVGANNQLARTTSGSTNYNMDFSPTFTNDGTKNITTINWASNATNVPTADNPLKKGAYTVKVTSTSGAVLFTDSLLLATSTSFVSTNPLATTIPTYNIISGN